MQHAFFASTLNSLAGVADWLQKNRPPGIDDLLWSQAQTALLEGFSNAVSHAHASLQNPPDLLLTFAVRAGRLRMTIRDYGDPFDLEAAWGEQSQVRDDVVMDSQSAGFLELPEAHWGLVFLYRLHRDYGWDICYKRIIAGGNLLVLTGPCAVSASS